MQSLPDPLVTGPVPHDHLVALPPHGTTVIADELRTQLVAASDAGSIGIDASAVESIGQAVIQLLLAAGADAVSQGRQIVIHNPSQAFSDRIGACGLAAAMGLSVKEFHS